MTKSSAKYQYKFSLQAKQDLEQLDSVTRKMIGQRLRYFIESGDPLHFGKKLVDSSIGTYRFRIGDWRVVFDLHGSDIVVLRVRNRRDVYKR